MHIPYLTTPRARIFWGNIRLPQLFFLCSAGCNGILIAHIFMPSPIVWSAHTVFIFLALLSAIGFGWTASCAANDAYDRAIDVITNPQRPLPRDIFTPQEFLRAAHGATALALVCGLALGMRGAFMITCALALNWLYNQPPLRLKRFPFIATGIAALYFQTLTYAGFFAVRPDATFAAYPFSFYQILVALCVLMLVIPFKDFKDVSGDRAGGVLTLPILCGWFWSRIIVLCGVALGIIVTLFFVEYTTASAWYSGVFTWIVCAGILFASAFPTSGITPRTMFWWFLLPGTFFVGSILLFLLTH